MEVPERRRWHGDTTRSRHGRRDHLRQPCRQCRLFVPCHGAFLADGSLFEGCEVRGAGEAVRILRSGTWGVQSGQTPYLEGGCEGTGIPGAHGCTPTSADGLLALEPGKAARWECAKLA
jgi:hypothetical protein